MNDSLSTEKKYGAYGGHFKNLNDRQLNVRQKVQKKTLDFSRVLSRDDRI